MSKRQELLSNIDDILSSIDEELRDNSKATIKRNVDNLVLSAAEGFWHDYSSQKLNCGCIDTEIEKENLNFMPFCSSIMLSEMSISAFKNNLDAAIYQYEIIGGDKIRTSYNYSKQIVDVIENLKRQIRIYDAAQKKKSMGNSI